MHIPPLTASGDLPVGIHAASLREMLERFGAPTGRRKVLAGRLERIYQIAAATGHLARFLVFGSNDLVFDIEKEA